MSDSIDCPHCMGWTVPDTDIGPHASQCPNYAKAAPSGEASRATPQGETVGSSSTQPTPDAGVGSRHEDALRRIANGCCDPDLVAKTALVPPPVEKAS